WTKLPHTHFLSYPAAPIAAFTKSVYSKLPLDRLPTLAEVSEVYAEIEPRLRGVTANASGSGGESLAAIQARQAAERTTPRPDGTIPWANDFTGASAADALAALDKYRRPPRGTPPPPGFEGYDFHGALMFIGEHPQLARNLRLVFDLTVPLSIFTTIPADVPAGQPQPNNLAVSAAIIK